MVLKIQDIKIKGYERVIHATNSTTNLDCIISIHNTKLGPALGGVRSWDYRNFEDHKKDVLRLSEAMTLKNSLCGINFGGGKAVINLHKIKKTPELYQSYAEAVQYLNGQYLTAGDVNTFKNDLEECLKFSNYVYGINVETSAPTAKGLLYAIITTYNFIYKNKKLKDMHIAISGVGKVGSKLAKLLSKYNVSIAASSINLDLIKKLKTEIKINEIHSDKLFNLHCDIISPCALGGAINELNKKYLNCKAIVGAANNQLENPEIGNWLIKNNIIYAPDYLVNSGGVIAIASEINKSEDLVENQLKKISNRLELVLRESIHNNESSDLVAKRMSWERINS